MKPDEILDYFRTKSIDKEWAFAEAKPSDTAKWTHGYHRYPAKFIPQLVERLADEYISAKDAHINDPFMGCGTTIVTGISRGFRASGTDINKIAHLITRVKATPIAPDVLEEKVSQFMDRIKAIVDSPSQKPVEPFIPEKHIERIDYWFPEKHRDELGRILRVITEEPNPVFRDFFLIAFSNILKNCSIWLQGSTKPTRDFKKNPSRPLDVLRRQINKMKRGNLAFHSLVPAHVATDIPNFLDIRIGDARHQPAGDESVDLIVSSSPYVTSYEYADLHQLSTIWLDFADDLTEYRKRFIGTAYKKYEGEALPSRIALDIVEQMNSRSKKMAKEVEAFFLDMEGVFRESFRILKKQGRCCFVIGDTKLKGVDILNAEVFAELLQHVGFKLDRVIKREIPSKILPQKRDEKTGRFASNANADTQAYPIEYIVIGLKE